MAHSKCEWFHESGEVMASESAVQSRLERNIKLRIGRAIQPLIEPLSLATNRRTSPVFVLVGHALCCHLWPCTFHVRDCIVCHSVVYWRGAILLLAGDYDCVGGNK